MPFGRKLFGGLGRSGAAEDNVSSSEITHNNPPEQSLADQAARKNNPSTSPTVITSPSTDTKTTTTPADQNDDLWKEAYEKLKSEEPDLYASLLRIVGIEPNVPQDVPLEQRLQAIKVQKQRLMTDKQWVLYWQQKRKGFKGDSFDKIVKVFQIVKPIGDTAAGLDPVHAGIPWACVSMLLPLILNYSDQREAALTGLQEVTDIVQHFSSMDWSFLQTCQDRPKVELRKAIIALYTKTLAYEVSAMVFFNKSKLRKYFEALPKLDDWPGTLSEVKKHKGYFESLLQMNDYQDQRELSAEFRQRLDLVAEKLTEMNKTEEEHFRIVEWVSDIPYASRHNTVRQHLKNYPEAGTWIFGEEEYVKWLSSAESPVFWLRGTVGTGKSSIISTLVEGFYSDVSRDADHRMLYFYCIAPTTEEDVLRSLVAQLAWSSEGKSIHESVVQQYRKSKSSMTGPLSRDDCVQLLPILCRTVPRVTVVIDALDECTDYGSLLFSLKEVQNALLDYQKANLKFVFSSRMLVIVDVDFPKPHCVLVTPEGTSRELLGYVRKEVKSKQNFLVCDEQTSKQLSEKVVTVLMDHARGMFKWVTLELAIIFPRNMKRILPQNVEITLKKIENNRLPLMEALSDAYETVYRMNAEAAPYHAKVSTAVYKWLLCCKTSLPINELLRAISLSFQHDPELKDCSPSSLNRDDVLYCCSNFVVQGSDDTFQFAHISVKEYLQRHDTVKAQYQEEECHLLAMNTCMLFFNLPASRKKEFPEIHSDPRSARQPMSFSLYVILYWAIHSNKATLSRRLKEPLYGQFVMGNRRSPSFEWWFSQLRPLFRPGDASQELWGLKESQEPELIVGAIFDLEELIENAVQRGKSTESCTSGNVTPLLAAVRFRSANATKKLLDLGANPHAISWANTHRIYRANMGRPLPIEDMSYWLFDNGIQCAKDDPVLKVLLTHDRSREVLLDQMLMHAERYLINQGNMNTVLQILFEYEKLTILPNDLLRSTIREYGINCLTDFFGYIEKDHFTDDLVLAAIRQGSADAVERLFEWKDIESVNEAMVTTALISHSMRHPPLRYLFDRFGDHIITSQMIIVDGPTQEEIWKVILDYKGASFITEEMFQRFLTYGGIENLKFFLDRRGADFITKEAFRLVIASYPPPARVQLLLDRGGPQVITADTVTIAASQNGHEILEIFLACRGSLEDLITEEAVIRAIENSNMHSLEWLLNHIDDPFILSPKRLEEAIPNNSYHNAITELLGRHFEGLELSG